MRSACLDSMDGLAANLCMSTALLTIHRHSRIRSELFVSIHRIPLQCANLHAPSCFQKRQPLQQAGNRLDRVLYPSMRCLAESLDERPGYHGCSTHVPSEFQHLRPKGACFRPTGACFGPESMNHAWAYLSPETHCWSGKWTAQTPKTTSHVGHRNAPPSVLWVVYSCGLLTALAWRWLDKPPPRTSISCYMLYPLFSHMSRNRCLFTLMPTFMTDIFMSTCRNSET